MLGGGGGLVSKLTFLLTPKPEELCKLVFRAVEEGGVCKLDIAGDKVGLLLAVLDFRMLRGVD